MQSPSVIYKYVDRAGAIKTLQNNTIKFTIPENLNDPFDLFVDDWMNFDKEHFVSRYHQFQMEMLKNDPFQYFLGTRHGRYDFGHMTQIGKLSHMLQFFDEEKYKYVLDGMSKFTPAHLAYPIHEDINGKQFVQKLLGAGIFSCTTSKENLLMWSHYAEQHKGVVIGFDASVIESIAKLNKVSYSDRRFSYYDMINRIILFGKSNLGAEVSNFFWGSILSKSPDWAYEQEYRSIILGEPNGPHGDRLVLMDPSSIKEIYFGIRSDKEFRSDVLCAIDNEKFKVDIYNTCMERNLYKLRFFKVR